MSRFNLRSGGKGEPGRQPDLEGSPRAPTAPPTARERRGEIVERLSALGYTPFDLLSWDSLLNLLASHRRSRAWCRTWRCLRRAATRGSPYVACRSNQAQSDRARRAHADALSPGHLEELRTGLALAGSLAR